MKTLKFIVALGTVLFLSACEKKKYPESVADEKPVFYSSFSLNSIPITFGAGIDGYRMYSSFEQNQSGVYALISEIKPSACVANCPNSIKIEIRDARVSLPGDPVLIDAALHKGFYNYLSPSLQVHFSSAFNKQASSYKWDFDDGSDPSTLKDPVHTFQKGGNYSVCLTVTGSDGCMSTICNRMKIGYQEGSCITSIVTTSIVDKSVSFSQITKGKEPYEYFWEFGDGDTSTDPHPVHNYNIKGGYPVRLMVTDANGDVAYANYNVIVGNDISSCSSNYSVTSVLALTNNPSLSEVTITYVDPSGIIYKSSESIQTSGSNFEILSVEDFENNENGEATKKLHVKFNCKLFNGTKSILLENAVASICVAYKK